MCEAAAASRSLRGTIQGKLWMPSPALCIVSDMRGEWPECKKNGQHCSTVNVPVLKQPTCVNKREDMNQTSTLCGVFVYKVAS